MYNYKGFSIIIRMIDRNGDKNKVDTLHKKDNKFEENLMSYHSAISQLTSMPCFVNGVSSLSHKFQMKSKDLLGLCYRLVTSSYVDSDGESHSTNSIIMKHVPSLFHGIKINSTYYVENTEFNEYHMKMAEIVHTAYNTNPQSVRMLSEAWKRKFRRILFQQIKNNYKKQTKLNKKTYYTIKEREKAINAITKQFNESSSYHYDDNDYLPYSVAQFIRSVLSNAFWYRVYSVDLQQQITRNPGKIIKVTLRESHVRENHYQVLCLVEFRKNLYPSHTYQQTINYIHLTDSIDVRNHYAMKQQKYWSVLQKANDFVVQGSQVPSVLPLQSLQSPKSPKSSQSSTESIIQPIVVNNIKQGQMVQLLELEKDRHFNHQYGTVLEVDNNGNYYRIVMNSGEYIQVSPKHCQCIQIIKNQS